MAKISKVPPSAKSTSGYYSLSGINKMRLQFPPPGRRGRLLLRRGRVLQSWRPLTLILFGLTLGAILCYKFLDLQLEDRSYELDIRKGFNWSLDIPNFAEAVKQLGANPGNFSSLTDLPINYQFSRIKFLHNVIDKKKEELKPLGILIVVKSAVNNIAKRDAIRSTWGQSDYLNREDTKLSGDLPTKVVFICGLPTLPPNKVITHPDPGIEKVAFINFFPFDDELKQNDIVVADFADVDVHITYKTILALRWAEEEYRPGFQYLFLVEDDMYVDLVNLVKYLKEFPNQYFQEASGDSGLLYYEKMENRHIQTGDIVRGRSILKRGLYNGFVYYNNPPMRRAKLDRRIRTWLTSKEEYPYNFYPPFAPGPGIIMSRNTVHKFYYASFLTKPFKLDDVYLGIIANKLGIIPVTNPHIFPFDAGHRPPTEKDLKEGIAIHGFCTKKMLDIWRRRKIKGSVDC